MKETNNGMRDGREMLEKSCFLRGSQGRFPGGSDHQVEEDEGTTMWKREEKGVPGMGNIRCKALRWVAMSGPEKKTVWRQWSQLWARSGRWGQGALQAILKSLVFTQSVKGNYWEVSSGKMRRSFGYPEPWRS